MNKKSINSTYLALDKCADQYMINIGKSALKTPKGGYVQHKNEDFIKDMISELKQYPILNLKNSSIVGEQLSNVSLYNLFSTLMDYINSSSYELIENISVDLLNDPILHSVAGPEKIEQLSSWQPIIKYLESIGITDSFDLLNSGVNTEESEFWSLVSFDNDQLECVNFKKFTQIISKEWVEISNSERVVVISLAAVFGSIISSMCFVNGECTSSDFSNAVVAGSGSHYAFGVDDEVSAEEAHRQAYKDAYEAANICKNFLKYYTFENSDEEKVKQIISQGETDKIEFKQTLSFDIKKQSKEKYIELAVLKNINGFLNSRGGVLLIGISDNGDCAGIDSEINKLFKGSVDNFLLHFKNILKTNVGEDFYPFIEYDIIKVDKKIILRVNCKRSKKPCYLNGKDFYVRTNPATDKLEGPRLVNYIQNHFP